MNATVLADACREAGLAFLDGAALGWGRRELSRWADGPYREATLHGVLTSSSPASPPASPLSSSYAEHEMVRALREAGDILAARRRVLASLEAVRTANASRAFVERTLAAGYVVARHDSVSRASGRVIWVAVDVPALGLAERVTALFVVDYLVRPKDYVTDLSVCATCETVLFDRSARLRGDCGAHAPHAWADSAVTLTPEAQAQRDARAVARGG